ASCDGTAPGVFAGVLAGFLTDFVFIPPLYDFQIEMDDVLRTLVYVTVSLVIGKLVRARQRAEAEVKDREGLLSYVAHELRTPLGAISSWAELIRRGTIPSERLRPAGQMLADRERLSQVVGNVLNNAIRFTPAGGEVHVRLRGDGRRAVLTVTDTGGGIPPNLLPRIFEPGMRHAGSEGFGLGLTIAQDIVEHHAGTISAHSDGEGLGASFTIVLPVSAAARG